MAEHMGGEQKCCREETDKTQSGAAQESGTGLGTDRSASACRQPSADQPALIYKELQPDVAVNDGVIVPLSL